MGGGFLSYIFLSSPVFVIIALIGIRFSYKDRSTKLRQISDKVTTENLPPEKKIKNYGLRLLIMFGVVILGCVLLGSASMLISSINDNVI